MASEQSLEREDGTVRSDQAQRSLYQTLSLIRALELATRERQPTTFVLLKKAGEVPFNVRAMEKIHNQAGCIPGSLQCENMEKAGPSQEPSH